MEGKEMQNDIRKPQQRKPNREKEEGNKSNAETAKNVYKREKKETERVTRFKKIEETIVVSVLEYDGPISDRD